MERLSDTQLFYKSVITGDELVNIISMSSHFFLPFPDPFRKHFETDLTEKQMEALEAADKNDWTTDEVKVKKLLYLSVNVIPNN